MPSSTPASRTTSEQRKEHAEQYSAGARYASEAFGTFLLVAGGVGTAIFASAFPDDGNALGVGFLGVALAFGLTLVAGIYAVGHISGGHFNPAVSIGFALAGRTEWRHIPGYIVAQIVGGVAGAGVVALIAADGPAGYFDAARESGFASNGFGAASPGGFGLGAVILAEVVLTAVFVGVILSVTSKSEYKSVAPLAIGLTLTLVHLISIPISNTSVNPARSIAAAVFAGPDALGQVWVFLLAPVLGAAIAGLASKTLHRTR
ncbi:aquaporin Z [Rathayibacter sp. VKM Ac-2856]|uniref:aquaporin Z n=1 Tax=unclassified Rathayibacter TaxID=2609250 RepID=UPI001563E148|nr:MULTISPECIES: aquaporin Z [unclassified Rathayibacter]NQX06129.1 aquaporin Z [Rathayibacter sp. VKM Ac-2858]NQX20921.1 aquaporin Z [Rathayibacter sp. VKM Ac-2856]